MHATERRWREAWARAGCHRAPSEPRGEKYFGHDAAPFPNGPIHLGHVRTYVLGDVTARYQRLRGRCVLYVTGFDAFGLPNELAAAEAGVSPEAYTRDCMALMRRQLDELGVSYDWSRVVSTCDPACYRWTQWLFLELYDAGLVERRKARLNWCPACRTTLARLQVEEGACWRCRTPVEQRDLPQWFIATSRYEDRLRRTMEQLPGWSEGVKGMIRGMLDEAACGDGARGSRVGDWLVSRQRSWGTPIPLVHCVRCGVRPVPRDALPVALPDTIDWTLGAGALARCDAFVKTACPACGDSARRETDTLDCFFDDVWCFMQALVVLPDPPGFTRANLDAWMPVDRCHSGLDTFYYFHLYRFLGAVLHDRGLLATAEPIRRFDGSNLVLAGGRKMSKHLGNAVSPALLMREYGADALRLAVLWAGGPRRAVEWRPQDIAKAAALREDSLALFRRRRSADGGSPGHARSRAAGALAAARNRATARVTEFIEDFRPNAAIEELAALRRRIDRFLDTRPTDCDDESADGRVLRSVLADYAVLLFPFAPHTAEEAWHRLGGDGLVAQTPWPSDDRVRRNGDSRCP